VEQSLFRNNFQLSATYFNQQFKDIIQYISLRQNPLDPSFLNVASAESKGLELEAEMVIQAFRIGTSWTLLQTRVTDSGFDVGGGATFVDGQPLLRRPNQSFSSWITRTGDKADISAHFSRIGERTDRDFSTYPATRIIMPIHKLLSIESAWRAMVNNNGQAAVTFRIKGENLLDQNYQEIFGFQAPGRNLTIGATAHIN
jgi:vitamin B12 transporter